MTGHATAHVQAGVTVLLATPLVATDGAGVEFTVEDYWDRLSGESWMVAEGNPAATHYAVRSGYAGLPIDDEVVYGKVGNRGLLVHVSELGPVRS